ncbi:hypothetical protein LTR10_006719 [Elasticomyces elasticus]|nr:hypothetical protein LTR10_006719 [Elasticomyces elasticus]KAK4972880.1 hypothetical protein LTR42_006174 [Elasticomyces elasticus]
MLVLTGATGGLGGAALATILEKQLLGASDFRISSSNPQSAALKAAINAGVEVRYGSMKQPESLEHSFAGAEAVFLVSYPSIGVERYELHKAAIDAARKVGVKHILYTSLALGGINGENSKANVMQAHILTTAYLKASGLKWTILRYAPYAHLWNVVAGLHDLSDDTATELVIPEDGAIAYADRAEMGEATGRVLAQWVSRKRDPQPMDTDQRSQSSFEGQTLRMTGPEALTAKQVLQMYNEYTGKSLKLKELGTDGAIRYHQQKGSLPPEQIDFLANWATMSAAFAAGESETADPALEKILGRKPKTIADMYVIVFGSTSTDGSLNKFVAVAAVKSASLLRHEDVIVTLSWSPTQAPTIATLTRSRATSSFLASRSSLPHVTRSFGYISGGKIIKLSELMVQKWLTCTIQTWTVLLHAGLEENKYQQLDEQVEKWVEYKSL